MDIEAILRDDPVEAARARLLAKAKAAAKAKAKEEAKAKARAEAMSTALGSEGGAAGRELSPSPIERSNEMAAWFEALWLRGGSGRDTPRVSGPPALQRTVSERPQSFAQPLRPGPRHGETPRPAPPRWLDADRVRAEFPTVRLSGRTAAEPEPSPTSGYKESIVLCGSGVTAVRAGHAYVAFVANVDRFLCVSSVRDLLTQTGRLLPPDA